jgi:hypothetical protein
MSQPAKILIAHALETLPGASLPRQAELYRAVAEMTPGRAERRRFEEMATHCDALIAQHALLESKQQLLVLDFKRGAI